MYFYGKKTAYAWNTKFDNTLFVSNETCPGALYIMVYEIAILILFEHNRLPRKLLSA